jgi:hypothetical protein
MQMLPVDGGAQFTTAAQVVLASRDVAPVVHSSNASPEPVPAARTPTPPAPSDQSACAFTLQIDQDTNRLIMEWSDRASGLLVLQIPAKTAALAFAESNYPASRGKYVHGRA